MQRFHPAVEDLGEAGEGSNVLDCQSLAGEGRGRATSADHAHSGSLAGLRQSIEAGFVEHTDKHTADRHGVDDRPGTGGVVVGRGCFHEMN